MDRWVFHGQLKPCRLKKSRLSLELLALADEGPLTCKNGRELQVPYVRKSNEGHCFFLLGNETAYCIVVVPVP